MRVREAIVFFACAAIAARASLVTERTDSDFSAPTVDGVISAGEYGPGNAYSFTGGGAGFGGQLGSATLYVKSDVTNIFLGFSGLGIPADGNQYIVYFHTRAGGFQVNGEMTDVSDAGRRNVSLLSTGGMEHITFEEGGVSNKPDFALFFYNNSTGFQALVELRGAGQNHLTLPRTVAGLGTASPEFRIPRSALGLAVSGVVDIAAFEISATGFLSNEGIPSTGLGANPGFANGQTNYFRDFHRFVPKSLAEPVGLTQRVANTTLAFPPLLPPPTTNSYTTTNAFPGLVFTNPICVATPPGETNRLFVVEQAGRIIVITNLANPNRTVFLDISARASIGSSFEGGLLGLAFHPDYASNRQFYVYYTATGSGFSNRVSRFLTQAGNPNEADSTSELVLIGQFDEVSNHNGGDLHFGPDGYLYVSLGDEGSSNDSPNNSQTITKDFFSGILRIDVDKKPGNLPPHHHPAILDPTNYWVPADNPFVGVTNFNGTNFAASAVRTEFWAVGLRNPFRMSFDPVTGELYTGDVGQNAREEIDLIRPGGNYGWAYREGMIAGPKSTTNPASAFINPLLDYTRGDATNQGYVVTGGRVYRGSQFPELVGRYLFCDYASGHIWSLSHNGTNATSFRWHATDNNIASFGTDPRNGEMLLIEHTNSTPATPGFIKRLAPAAVVTSTLPATLAAAGIFADLTTLTPFPGIIPYEIEVPFWSDGARKTRWFSVPPTNQTITFDARENWTFPTGTVWIKHFDLELTSGVPASARRIETRVLVKNATGSGGYGVTYRWGDSLTNAALVPDGGLDEAIVINDGGTIRTQIWRYPSRAECLACHQTAAGFALGFNTPQVNRDRNYGGITTNQLRALSAAGYFSNAPTAFHLLRRLANPTNTAFSIEHRARSYLQSNCGQCHHPGPANWDARIFTSLPETRLVNGPLNNNWGSTNNRVIKPGSITNSVLHTRMGLRGTGQMPPLASSLVDTQGLALIAQWITSGLAGYESYADWQVRHFGSTNAPLSDRQSDPDADGNVNILEYLTGTDPTNLVVDDAWTMTVRVSNGIAAVHYPRVPNRGFDVQAATNLLTGPWLSLDVPENSPFFSAAPGPAAVPDPASTNLEGGYYRVFIYEP